MRISLTDPRLSHGERLRDVAEKSKAASDPSDGGQKACRGWLK